MKMISAVINLSKLVDVRRALTDIGIQGMTITEVKGFGRQKGHKEVYRSAEYEVRFLPKLKVEVAVPDEMLKDATEAIRGAALSGSVGDGKLFVFALDDALRIRTGEKGKEAI